MQNQAIRKGEGPNFDVENRSEPGSLDTKKSLIANALAMVETLELGALTLRPLADRSGVSVATLNHHFGDKSSMLETVVSVAIERELAFAEHWRERLDQIPARRPRDRAVLAKALFDNWIALHRREILVLLDLLHLPGLFEVGAQRLAQWSNQMGAFWSQVFFGTSRFGELAMGFVIDEAGFALCAGGDPAYASLRTLCLESLIRWGAQCEDSDPAFFASLVAALAPRAVPRSIGERNARGRAVVECVADMLKAHRPAPITHRAVAARCDVSPATVVYQFGSTEDLIVAGLYALIEKFHMSREQPGAGSKTPLADLVRATGIIALKAARIPALTEHALDMRRRRGENVTQAALIEAGYPARRAADPVFRQVFALCVFGTRRFAYAIGGPTDQQAGEVVLDWVRTIPPD
ncbi:MAG: TetR/AcrR family transcriptional regulator [Erythrobacter sp.]|nr:TetR/AcrR family transcriptional regulator [Erythrobacter sp.]